MGVVCVLKAFLEKLEPMPLDILVGSLDSCKCLQGSFKYYAHPDIAVSPSIFGWTVTGPLDYQPSTQLLKLQVKEDTLHQDLQQLWELDKTPETPHLTTEDETTLYHFQDTHEVEEDGRYKVRIPKKPDAPSLGESRNIVLKRFLQNERSLQRRASSQNSMLLCRSMSISIMPRLFHSKTFYFLIIICQFMVYLRRPPPPQK